MRFNHQHTLRSKPHSRLPGYWWRQTGSNRRPDACKATALPAELCPQTLQTGDCPDSNAISQPDRLPQIASDLRRLVPPNVASQHLALVGLERLELSTSRLSSARSNQLSYRPIFATAKLLQQSLPAAPSLHATQSAIDTNNATKTRSLHDDPHQSWRPSNKLVREERETKAALSRVVVTSHGWS